MGARSTFGPAPTSCGRCRRQKRKCDRAAPACSLCTRLGLTCKYEGNAVRGIPQSRAPPPVPIGPSKPSTFTLSHLKPRLLQSLSGVRPVDVAARYFSTVETWFPIIAEDAFSSSLTSTWDEAPVTFSLLSLAIVLLTTTPEIQDEDGCPPPSIMAPYLAAKSCIAMVEVAGVNSLQVVQSKVLVALFEAAHGFYPAAYMSIGAAVSAIEGLLIFEGRAVPSVQDTTVQEEDVELMITWRGILILDRHIAIENGRWPPVTRGRALPELCLSTPIRDMAQKSTSRQRFLRLFEASTLADKIHLSINKHLPEPEFKLEELVLIVQTLNSLEIILHQEISITMNLMAFENGTKQCLVDEGTRKCREIASSSLNTVIEIVVKMAEPFSDGQHTLDSNILPPFVIFLVYKTSALLTWELQVEGESKKSLQQLKILRQFLASAGNRWLGAKRFLALLNEETIPRTLKALDTV